jgi:hypothetical protein
MQPFLLAMNDPKEQQRLTNEGVALVESLPCTNDAEFQRLGELLKICKQQIKAYDSKRKEMSAPLRKITAEINSWFTPIVNSYKGAEKTLKGKIQYYSLQKAAEATRAREAITDAHGRGDMAEVLVQSTYLAPAPEIDGVSERKSWDFKVLNLKMVPRRYLELNVKKVRADIQAGIRTITGIEVFQKTSLAVRSK